MDTPHANDGPGDPTPAPSGSVKLTVPAAVLQFFVFPLAVVLVCGVIGLFICWLTYEAQGPAELLKDVTRAGAARETRFYAASQLARLLEGRVREARERPAATADGLVLPPEVEALAPALLEALPSAGPKFRIALLAALGDIGDPAAAPAALADLAHEDAGVRMQAAFTLGQLQDARAVAPLQGRLQDPVHDVRWNAALALARFADSPPARESARPVLAQMLDRPYLEDVVARTARATPRGSALERTWQEISTSMWEGMACSQEDYVVGAMVNAMRAVVRMKDRSFEPKLEAISSDAGANLKVRDHAMQTLAVLRAGS